MHNLMIKTTYRKGKVRTDMVKKWKYMIGRSLVTAHYYIQNIKNGIHICECTVMYCLTYMCRGHSPGLCTRELNMSQKRGHIWSEGCGGIEKRPRGSDPVRTSNCTYNSSIRAISFVVLIYIHIRWRISRFQCVSLDIHRVRIKTNGV